MYISSVSVVGNLFLSRAIELLLIELAGHQTLLLLELELRLSVVDGPERDEEGKVSILKSKLLRLYETIQVFN